VIRTRIEENYIRIVEIDHPQRVSPGMRPLSLLVSGKMRATRTSNTSLAGESIHFIDTQVVRKGYIRPYRRLPVMYSRGNCRAINGAEALYVSYRGVDCARRRTVTLLDGSIASPICNPTHRVA
jgi:hypothetical protein